MSDTSAVVPLESNPEVFNQLAYDLGLSKKYEFVDIYSLTDESLLSFVPRPIKAIVLLFPITDQFEALRKSLDEQYFSTSDISETESEEKVYWFPQKIKNACGLYALLHAIVNVSSDSDIERGSNLADFISKMSRERNADKRTDLILDLEKSYADAAQQGQTAAPEANESIDLHFISFVYNAKDGHVYELDGRRRGPIDLGKAMLGDDVLSEPAVVQKIQQYMDIADEKNKYNYSLMGIAPSFD